MTTVSANSHEIVHFYAPDPKTHSLFELEHKDVIAQRSTNFDTWVVKTYSQLKKAGISCQIVNKIPKQGIVLTDRDTLGNTYPYLGAVMMICAKADREFHPSAHFHVVQNQADIQNPQNALWNPHVMPHWKQPGMIPRSKHRSTRVENIAFLGTRTNLAPELKSEQWRQALADLGCNWLPLFAPEKWADYGHLDVVIAVRGFDDKTHPHKPASKLVNCWSAGVPAILAPESAFMAERQSDLDFLVVRSVDDAIQAVKTLKQNPDIYSLMVKNGRIRAEAFSDEKVTERWVDFFQDHVFPQYHAWVNSPEQARWLQFSKRYAILKINRMKKRIGKALSI